MGFPKHEWLRLLTRKGCDKRLTPWIRLLAVDLSTSASPEDGTFTVHRRTVQERMGKSKTFIIDGYALLEELGYIKFVRAGRTGRPSAEDGDRLPAATWRLSFPITGQQPLTGYPDNRSTAADKQVNSGGQTGQQRRTNRSTATSEIHRLSSENAVPVGLIEGL
jgi:hypothetical protein